MYLPDPPQPHNTYLHHFIYCAYSLSNMALFIWRRNSWEASLPTVRAPDTEGLNKNAFVKDNSEGVLSYEGFLQGIHIYCNIQPSHVQCRLVGFMLPTECCPYTCGFHPYRWSAALFVLRSASSIPAAPISSSGCGRAETSAPSNNNTTWVIR